MRSDLPPLPEGFLSGVPEFLLLLNIAMLREAMHKNGWRTRRQLVGNFAFASFSACCAIAPVVLGCWGAFKRGLRDICPALSGYRRDIDVIGERRRARDEFSAPFRPVYDVGSATAKVELSKDAVGVMAPVVENLEDDNLAQRSVSFS